MSKTSICPPRLLKVSSSQHSQCLAKRQALETVEIRPSPCWWYHASQQVYCAKTGVILSKRRAPRGARRVRAASNSSYVSIHHPAPTIFPPFRLTGLTAFPARRSDHLIVIRGSVCGMNIVSRCKRNHKAEAVASLEKDSADVPGKNHPANPCDLPRCFVGHSRPTCWPPVRPPPVTVVSLSPLPYVRLLRPGSLSRACTPPRTC